MSEPVELAWSALRSFVDPCSEGMGRPVSIVDLGLIETIRIDDSADGRMHVEFCPTGPSCFFQIPMMQRMEQLVTEATGLDCVVTISEEIWTPDRMAGEADIFATRRRKSTSSARQAGKPSTTLERIT